jgi:hypothetical protein
MRYFWPRVRWTFISPPHAFIWGVLATLMTACAAYWALPGVRWYGSLAAALQLAGVFFTVVQILQLRNQLGAKPLRAIYSEHWKSFPKRRVHDASGILIGGEATLEGMTAYGYGTTGTPSTEEHLAQLWTSVRALEGQLRETKTTMEAHKKNTDASQEALGRRVDEQMGTLFSRIQEALTASPFLALFGVWLFVCGSWMQLVLAVFHASPVL